MFRAFFGRIVKVLCNVGAGDWGEEKWELREGGGPGQDSSSFCFGNQQSFWFCQLLKPAELLNFVLLRTRV